MSDEEAEEIRVETYLLGLLAEKCGEVCQCIGKALRFGLNTRKHKEVSITTVMLLEEEIGDVMAYRVYSFPHESRFS